MPDGTIIQQGRFTSDGTAQDIAIRSDVDWMEVINETQWATTQTPGRGVKFEWQRGMTAGHAFEYTKADGADTLQAEKVTSGGFEIIDPNAGLGSAVTGTTITKADPPVCTAAGHGYSNGDLVILSSLTNMPQLSQIYWEIGSVTTNTFELTYMDTNTANFTAESAFTVRKVPKFSNWVPPQVAIVGLTTGSTTSVVLSATVASYTVGQTVRLQIDESVWGTSGINGQLGTITAINTTTNALTLDIDSSSSSSFAWPASSAVPFTFATIVPVGTTGNLLDDATLNTAELAIRLGAGIDGPAGSSSDVIYWRAGKSFSVSNS
jgi:hypothetical protein